MIELNPLLSGFSYSTYVEVLLFFSYIVYLLINAYNLILLLHWKINL